MVRNFNVQAVHKYTYPGINFRDDAVWAEPAGWTTDNGAGCGTFVVASFDGHRKVLRLSDVSAANSCHIYTTFEGQASGTIDLWIGTTDITKKV